MKFVSAAAFLLAALATQSPAASILMFEGFAPPGGLTNVSTASPYTEAGFTLTPSNDQSAVFDSAATAKFPADATSWFGFAASNTITLTGPAPFSLDTALLGPSSLGSGNIDFTVVGNLVGGGTESITFLGLTTATSENIGFTNLSSATFSATSDSGIDNISLTSAAPEPLSLLLLGVGLAGIGAMHRRRQISKA